MTLFWFPWWDMTHQFGNHKAKVIIQLKFDAVKAAILYTLSLEQAPLNTTVVDKCLSRHL